MGTLGFDLVGLQPHLFVQRQGRRPQRGQQLNELRRHRQVRPVALPVPFAGQAVTILQGQAAPPLDDHFQVPAQTLPQAALAALTFLNFGGHAHQSQGMGIAGDGTIQRTQHRPGVSAVGFDPQMLVVPVAGADDVIGHAQGGELPVQDVAEGSGFVTGDDPPALGDLFLHPDQQVLGREPLGWFGENWPSYWIAATWWARWTSSASFRVRVGEV